MPAAHGSHRSLTCPAVGYQGRNKSPQEGASPAGMCEKTRRDSAISAPPITSCQCIPLGLSSSTELTSHRVARGCRSAQPSRVWQPSATPPQQVELLCLSEWPARCHVPEPSSARCHSNQCLFPPAFFHRKLFGPLKSEFPQASCPQAAEP